MTVDIDTSNFPLIMIKIGSEQIDDITIIQETLTDVFKMAKNKKSKVSIIVECGDFVGFGIIATVQIVKHLLSVRSEIKKYFNRCGITMDDPDGLFSYILSVYTPARPLKLFKSSQIRQAMQWVTIVDED